MLVGYCNLRQIDETANSLIYEGVREEDNLAVIIKLIKQEYPSSETIHRYRQEYEIINCLDHPGIIKTYGLIRHSNQLAIALENFSAKSLKDLALETKFTLSESLQLGIQIIDALSVVHQANVIHKDINPSNILFNRLTKTLKLIDFGIATQLLKEQKSIQNYDTIEGTLAYISPEQTGRMNRSLDYRTDYYSLGITLYQLLTQQLPFDAQAPLELIHCHLAKIPTLPHQLNPDIPCSVSGIVMKLMAKNAEERYQSAAGIKHDLEICLQQLNEQRAIAEFTLEQKDICVSQSRSHRDRFILRDKLYGREAEVKVLLDSFGRVAQGNAELILVEGFSGIGKTALIKEAHKPVTKEKGYFIEGKFDQFNRNIPFSAFLQAFSGLVKQLLAESDQQLAQWKKFILIALGNNAQVIIEIISELELILGRQPEVTELSGSAAQNRFNLVFSQFIQVFTKKEHPLVIFLDDLQWADSASLNLLKLLMCKSSNSSLLIIGAYRNNEISATHPLKICLQEVEQQNKSINRISLNPLTEKDINTLVTDTLYCSSTVAAQLSGLIYQKTKGNPFFTSQFLKGLYEDDCLKFDRVENIWQCDLAQIKQLAITDNVVEFMVTRLQKLPIATQDILKLAAFIGNQFELTTLSLISKYSEVEISDKLLAALQVGLIVPDTEIYQLFDEPNFRENNPAKIEISYRFLHDRLQQEAYNLISENQKQAFHLHIGRQLWQKLAEDELDEQLFAVVNHLNIGRDLISDRAESLAIAQLNLLACQKAKQAIAYKASLTYSQEGQKFISETTDQQNYSLWFELALKEIEAEFFLSNLETAEQLSQQVLAKTKTLSEKIRVYELKILFKINRNQMSEAISLAIEALDLLDLKFPQGEDAIRTKIKSLAQELKLPIEEIATLANLEPVQNQEKLAAIQILTNASSAAYISSPLLYPLFVLQTSKYCIEYGNSSLAASAYSWYGTFLSGLCNEFEAGYEFGKLSVALLEKFDAVESIAKVKNMFNVFIRPWQEPLRNAIADLPDAIECGFENGDVEYALYATVHYCNYSFYAGKSLSMLCRSQASHLQTIIKSKYDFHEGFLRINQQAVANLLGKESAPQILQGSLFDREKYLTQWQTNNIIFLLLCFYEAQTRLAYLFEDYESAILAGERGYQYRQAAKGTLYVVEHSFFYSLSILTNQSLTSSQADYITQAQEQMALWAASAPANFQHKYDLVEAERYRLLFNMPEAITFYDQAIAGAKESGFIQDEALANELAAKFYLGWGKNRVAAGYLQEAYYCYAQWGAKAKNDHLAKHYPELLRPILQQKNQDFDALQTQPSLGVSGTISVQSSFNLNDTFDLKDVLKSTQILTATLDLDELLKQLGKIILQNSGSDHLILALIDNSDKWQINLVADHQNIETSIRPLGIGLDNPIKLINYVKNTQEVVLVNNLETDLPIIDDYLLEQKPQSLLSLPLKHQEKTIGVIYLHSTTVKDLFSLGRKIILEFLCSQAAIAIHNAQLFESAYLKSSVIESSVDGMAILEDGKFIYLNQRHVSLFGYEINELLGKSWELLYQPEELQRLQEIVFPILGSTGKWSGEAIAKRKDGSAMPEELSLFMLEDGKLICICRDISDRKQAEQKLQASEQRYNTLFEKAADPILILKSGNIIACNQATLDLFDYAEKEDLFNLHPSQISPQFQPDGQISSEKELDMMKIAFEKGHHSFEWKHVRSDGQEFWADIMITVIQTEEDFLLHCVVRDISDRKKLEQAQNRLNAILEATTDYIGISDPEGNAIWLNKRMDLLYSENSHEPRKFASVHPDWVIQMIIEEAFPVAIQEGSWSGESALLDKLGNEIPVSQVIVAHKNPHGEAESFSTIMRDISDRKATEQKLQHLSEKLEIAIDSAQIGIWEWNAQTDQLAWNDRMFTIYGKQPEDFQGRFADWQDCVHPEDLPQAIDAFSNSFNNGLDHLIQEFRVIRKSDGKIRDLYAAASIQRNDQGQPLRMVGMNLDITDRKQLEQELKNSEARARASFQQAALGIAESNLETGQFTRTNNYFCEMTGYSRAELLNLNIKQITHPEDLEASKAYIQKLHQAEIDSFTVEKRYLRKDKSIFWAATTVSLIDLPGEQSKSYLAIIKDINDQKSAEAALLESETYHRNLFEQSAIGLHLCRLTGELVHANSAYAQIIGRAPEDLPELKYWEITPRKYAEAENEQLKSLESTGRYGPFEKEYIHKDGHLVPVRLSGVLVERNGEQFIWSSVENISDRKQAEQKLKFTQFALDNFADHVLIMKMDARIIDANPVCWDNLGYSYEELCSLTLLDICPVAETTWGKISQAIKENRSMYLESIHQRKSGEIFPVEVVANYLEYEGEEYIVGIVRDITERKANQKLMSLTKFAVDNTGMGIYWINQDGKIIDVNKSACISLGYGSDQLKQLSVWDISPGFPQEAWKPHWQQIKADIYKRFEAQHQTKDGRVFPVEITSNYIEYKGEGFIFAQAQDISDRKIADNNLRASEKRFRRAIEDAPFPIMIHAEDGEVLQISSTWTELTGYPHTEIPTTTDWAKYAYGENAAQIIEEVIAKKYALSSRWEEGEFKIQTKNGEQCLWQFSSAPLGSLPDGRRIVISMAVDITKQKQAEQDLKYLNEELEDRVRDRTFALEQANAKTERANKYERTLNRIIKDIRQSLDVSKIFSIATTEARENLSCERVSVFQFDQNFDGNFVYESVIKDFPLFVDNKKQIIWNDSFLKDQKNNPCNFNKIYQTNDIYEEQISPCHLEVLEKFEIRAYLIVPIFVGEKLWGLLAAYNHSQPRDWQPGEVKLFRQVSSHLGVALKQSELLQEMTTAKEKADAANKAKSTLPKFFVKIVLLYRLNNLKAWILFIKVGIIY